MNDDDDKNQSQQTLRDFLRSGAWLSFRRLVAFCWDLDLGAPPADDCCGCCLAEHPAAELPALPRFRTPTP